MTQSQAIRTPCVPAKKSLAHVRADRRPKIPRLRHLALPCRLRHDELCTVSPSSLPACFCFPPDRSRRTGNRCAAPTSASGRKKRGSTPKPYVSFWRQASCPSALLCRYRVRYANAHAANQASCLIGLPVLGYGDPLFRLAAVVSMGRCNTQLEVYLAEFKGQIRLRASIQRQPCPD